MSLSKSARGGKAKVKAPSSKPAAAKRKAEQPEVSVRVIEAPKAAVAPAMALGAAEQVRSDRAKALAAEIEQALRDGKEGVVLGPDAVQALLSALCKVYSGHTEGGTQYHAFSERSPVTPTDVMVTASGLLKAANLAVFELGMWQSWTGR